MLDHGLLLLVSRIPDPACCSGMKWLTGSLCKSAVVNNAVIAVEPKHYLQD